jgi:hypothetical protein
MYKSSISFIFKFNVEGLLRGDYESRMNSYAVGRQNGWLSANDIRQLEDLDLIPEEEGGDLYLINGNMTKLKDAGIFAAGAGKGTSGGKEEDTNEQVLEMGSGQGPGSGKRRNKDPVPERNDR